MTNIILIEQDGSFRNSVVAYSPKSFEELRILKEINGRRAYEVDDEQIKHAVNGGVVAVIKDKVVVSRPLPEAKHIMNG